MGKKSTGKSVPTSKPKPSGKKIKPKFGKGNAASNNLRDAMKKLAGDTDNSNE